MARGVNKAIIVGNLGNDPEMKYTQGGMAICKISVATTSVRKNKDGEQVEDTQWHTVKLFGKLGEIAGEYLKKGKQVYIEGEIRYNKWTGDDGVEKYFTEIVANEMQMLGGGGGGERAGSGGGGEAAGRAQHRQQAQGSRARQDRGEPPGREQTRRDDPFPDDDIPF